MSEFKIGKYIIGENYFCFIIVEVGSNYNGDINKVKEFVDIVVEVGVNVIKF